ncbi:MAG: hypothetical protein ABFC88_12815 [Thermoguttaceae bacterium]
MATLYVNRQVVNVLGHDAGKPRVTRQCIEILHLPGSATGNVYEVSATDNWDTLGEDLQEVGPVTVSASDALTFRETVVVRGPQYGLAEDSLRFSESAVAGRPWNLAAFDYLQQATTTYDPMTLEPTTVYTGLQDEASATKPPPGSNAPADSLNLTESASVVVVHATAIECKAADEWDTLDDSAYRVQANDGQETLVFTEEASVEVIRPATDVIEWTETATANVVRNLTAEDELDFRESVGIIGFAADVLHNYHPFVGGGIGGPTPPPATCPIPASNESLCRLYDLNDYADFVQLRPPEFGNKDRLTMNRISRETRGGSLIVFADAMWPKLQTMVLTIKGLSYAQVQAYLAFVENHLGVDVGFLDWEGFYWKGTIMNPNEPTVQDGKDSYTISFEFEYESWEP